MARGLIRKEIRDVRGWQTVRLPLVPIGLALQAAGYAKVQQVGNTADAFQMRLTGAGRRWLRGEHDSPGS